MATACFKASRLTSSLRLRLQMDLICFGSFMIYPQNAYIFLYTRPPSVSVNRTVCIQLPGLGGRWELWACILPPYMK